MSRFIFFTSCHARAIFCRLILMFMTPISLFILRYIIFHCSDTLLIIFAWCHTLRHFGACRRLFLFAIADAFCRYFFRYFRLHDLIIFASVTLRALACYIILPAFHAFTRFAAAPWCCFVFDIFDAFVWLYVYDFRTLFVYCCHLLPLSPFIDYVSLIDCRFSLFSLIITLMLLSRRLLMPFSFLLSRFFILFAFRCSSSPIIHAPATRALSMMLSLIIFRCCCLRARWCQRFLLRQISLMFHLIFRHDDFRFIDAWLILSLFTLFRCLPPFCFYALFRHAAAIFGCFMLAFRRFAACCRCLPPLISLPASSILITLDFAFDAVFFTLLIFLFLSLMMPFRFHSMLIFAAMPFDCCLCHFAWFDIWFLFSSRCFAITLSSLRFIFIFFADFRHFRYAFAAFLFWCRCHAAPCRHFAFSFRHYAAFLIFHFFSFVYLCFSCWCCLSMLLLRWCFHFRHFYAMSAAIAAMICRVISLAAWFRFSFADDIDMPILLFALLFISLLIIFAYISDIAFTLLILLWLLLMLSLRFSWHYFRAALDHLFSILSLFSLMLLSFLLMIFFHDDFSFAAFFLSIFLRFAYCRFDFYFLSLILPFSFLLISLFAAFLRHAMIFYWYFWCHFWFLLFMLVISFFIFAIFGHFLFFIYFFAISFSFAIACARFFTARYDAALRFRWCFAFMPIRAELFFFFFDVCFYFLIFSIFLIISMMLLRFRHDARHDFFMPLLDWYWCCRAMSLMLLFDAFIARDVSCAPRERYIYADARYMPREARHFRHILGARAYAPRFAAAMMHTIIYFRSATRCFRFLIFAPLRDYSRVTDYAITVLILLMPFCRCCLRAICHLLSSPVIDTLAWCFFAHTTMLHDACDFRFRHSSLFYFHISYAFRFFRIDIGEAISPAWWFAPAGRLVPRRMICGQRAAGKMAMPRICFRRRCAGRALQFQSAADAERFRAMPDAPARLRRRAISRRLERFFAQRAGFTRAPYMRLYARDGCCHERRAPPRYRRVMMLPCRQRRVFMRACCRAPTDWSIIIDFADLPPWRHFHFDAISPLSFRDADYYLIISDFADR